MASERFELFTSSFSQIGKSIQRIKNREMSPFGLRGVHVMCLFYLKQSESGLTAAELAELSGIDKGAVSRTIAELEEKGYTVCCESKEKRKYRAKITLTESGERITKKIDIVIEDAVEKSSIGLSETERDIFDKALILISQNLQRLASY